MAIIALIFSAICLYLLIRYCLLKKSIRKLTSDFHEARQNLRGEQHVLLSSPDQDLENLAIECNEYIKEYFSEQYIHQKEIQSIRNEITNLSHDLRTPITSILGYINLLQEEVLTEEQNANLEVVKRRSKDLNALIEQLYVYARLENKEMIFEMHPIDLYQNIREHLFSFYHELRQKEIELEMDFPKQEEPVLILGDETGLERVLLNLTTNAIKYSDSCVWVSLRHTGGQVFITYKTPRGNLTDYDIVQLFDRFYKKDSTRRSVQSTGLGLTIAKLIVEQMNGSISARGTKSDLLIEVSFPSIPNSQVS